MKFIFPQNYTFNSRLFGFIDYSVAILDIIWAGIVFLIANFIFKRLILKLSCCIVFICPVAIFSIVGVHGENFIYFLQYTIKYFLKPKLYLYR